MQKATITNEHVTEDKVLGVSSISIQNWIRNDDISFKRIYQLAEAMEWMMNISFMTNITSERSIIYNI